MAIDFKSFMSDIKKGAGKVKKSYSELVPALKEKKAEYKSRIKQNKMYNKLIDQKARKEMGKTTGMSMEQKQMEYIKQRKAAKKKYKNLR